jgi:hypothetical protein
MDPAGKTGKIKFGSFEHAHVMNLKQMAALTPAERVSIACSLDRMSVRLASGRSKPVGPPGNGR